ncbi:MAG: hypothetical protein JWQ43_2958 [Glaciihabitans sp.]|nr:hypothetical protein [Glaciihabitans sp.]
MTSLWQAEPPVIHTDAFEPDSSFDEVIVGGGITGLVAAVLFARQGRSVAVVEARTIGSGTTGSSTAKVSRLQGTQFSRVSSHGYPAILQAYAEASSDAFDWVIDYATDHAVPIERRDAYTYAGTPEGTSRVDHEYHLARKVGLDVQRLPEAPLPFRTHGAIRLADQAQIDPLRLLAALCAELHTLGGKIFEYSRVTGVKASSPAVVTTTDGKLSAEHVILATGTPILYRGLYFTKVSAQRSYAQSFEVPADSLPDGMFLNVETPTRSVRTAGSLLLTGGNGHGVGREASPQARVDELTAWTTKHWPEAHLTHAWSAQDYSAAHHVPFVGWLPRGRGKIFLATGYDKWGMTNGVAAALTLVADILGSNTHWQKTLHHRITLPRVIATGIGENAAVAWWYAREYASALSTRLPSTPPAEGEGQVGRGWPAPVAVSTVGSVTCRVSAVCPHLAAIVTWNDAEKSWDCPAHGSRFSADGTRLEGPTTRDLTRLAIP